MLSIAILAESFIPTMSYPCVSSFVFRSSATIRSSSTMNILGKKAAQIAEMLPGFPLKFRDFTTTTAHPVLVGNSVTNAFSDVYIKSAQCPMATRLAMNHPLHVSRKQKEVSDES